MIRVTDRIKLYFRFPSQEILFSVLPEGDTVISSIQETLGKAVRAALEASTEYGMCSGSGKKDFLYGVDNFIRFLESKFAFILSTFLSDHVLLRHNKRHCLMQH